MELPGLLKLRFSMYARHEIRVTARLAKSQRWLAVAVLLTALGVSLAAGQNFANPSARPAPPNAPLPNRGFGGLEIGKPAPDFELPVLKAETNAVGKLVFRITDEKVRLAAFRDKKVVCLFMASYTWPPFRNSAYQVEALYKAYKDNPKVAMYLVYVREAHPAGDARQKAALEQRFGASVDIAQHKTIEDRVLAASACMKGLNLTLPILIDSMEGTVQRSYYGAPAATTIVDLNGNVAYYLRGPSGVVPQKADLVLKQLLGTDAPAGKPRP